MKETQLVNQIVNYLNFKGHFVQRTNSGMLRLSNPNGRERVVRLAHPGTADITGCTKDGKFLAVECKIKPNKPTELQLAYLDEVRRRNGLALVAYDLDDVLHL